MRRAPVIDYPPEILTYLRSGWILYRNNIHDRWRLARYVGAADHYTVPDRVIDGMERAGEIRGNGPNEYRLVEE